MEVPLLKEQIKDLPIKKNNRSGCIYNKKMQKEDASFSLHLYVTHLL